MQSRYLRCCGGPVVFAAVVGLFPAFADAQFAFGAYLGKSSTFDCKVELHQPDTTDLVFHDVSWYDESWVNPKYYGFRFSYWNRKAPRWGFMLDFTHAKIYAELEATLRVTGTRQGEAVDGQEILSDTFSELAMSHGHNTVTINGMYRWIPDGAAGAAHRLTPYVGFGSGVAVPHVEVQTGDSVTHEYQFAGPTGQGFGGFDLRIWKDFSAFVEYRLNYASLSAELAGGGSLKLSPWTSHFSIGLTVMIP